MAFHIEESEGQIVIYRDYFERLLNAKKSLRDQLMIEASILQALRTGEVASLRVEWFDFEHGILQVLDSKKHKLLPKPLNPTVWKHAFEYISQKGWTTGLLFRREQPGGSKPEDPNAPLSTQAIFQVWRKLCVIEGIPPMSPRMGRAYFACVWCFGQPPYLPKKSMKGLQVILGHTNIHSTEAYLNKIIDFNDVYREFYEGLESPFTSECIRAAQCPVAIEDCYCNKFTSNGAKKMTQIGAAIDSET